MKGDDAIAIERGQRIRRTGNRMPVRRRCERHALRHEARERTRAAIAQRQIADGFRAHAFDFGLRERRLPHDLIEERERFLEHVRQRGQRHDRRIVARGGVEPRTPSVDRLRDLDGGFRSGALREQRGRERGEARFGFGLGGCAAAHEQLRRDQRHGIGFGSTAHRKYDNTQAVGERAFQRQRQFCAVRGAGRRRLLEGRQRLCHSGKYSIVVRFSTVRYWRATRCTSAPVTAR